MVIEYIKDLMIIKIYLLIFKNYKIICYNIFCNSITIKIFSIIIYNYKKYSNFY